MLYLQPQSTSTIRYFPFPYVSTCFVLTSAARFSLFGSTNSAGSGAPLADDLRDPARVHAPNARHAVVLEPLSEAFARVPVAVLERIVGDDQSADVDTVRFEKAQQTVLLRKLRNSVVADQRIGRHEDLTAVRRVGQAFGITGHGCVEDDFARNGRFGAEGVPFELSAVLEDQTGGFFVRHYLSVSYGLSSLAETVFWLRIVSESQRYG